MSHEPQRLRQQVMGGSKVTMIRKHDVGLDLVGEFQGGGEGDSRRSVHGGLCGSQKSLPKPSARHMRYHTSPPASWCECCVRARSVASPHRAAHPDEKKGDIPLVAMDLCYMGQKSVEDSCPSWL